MRNQADNIDSTLQLLPTQHTGNDVKPIYIGAGYTGNDMFGTKHIGAGYIGADTTYGTHNHNVCNRTLCNCRLHPSLENGYLSATNPTWKELSRRYCFQISWSLGILCILEFLNHNPTSQ